MKLFDLKQSIVDTIPLETNQLLVAVSGGVDSVILLHLLRSQVESLNISLQVAHLDHQIRPESSADADFVRQLCGQWDIPCHIETCAVPALAEQDKISLEMAGRNARRDFLHRIAERVNAQRIVLAHHRDDQVETFMLRLLRGSGQSGLTAMRVHQGICWRPLLNCSRGQILDYAREHQLNWVEDESNGDPAFLRNRLRAQIIPQFLDINPQFAVRIGDLTQQFQLEESYWQQQVEGQFEDLVVSKNDGLRLDRTALLTIHPALRIRILREALRQIRGDLQGVETIHLHAIEDLLVSQRSQAQLDLPGCWVARRYQTLWVRAATPELPKSFDLLLPVPGELELPDGRIIRTSIQGELEGESSNTTEYSLAELSLPLRVRSWKAGDRFEPLGMDGHKKLKQYFSDNRVESETRLQTPLLVSGNEILWIAGLRRSCHAVAGHDKGMSLRVELL